MFIDYILQWARDKGYAAVYGSPEQVNEMLTNVPFADYTDGTAVIMHLVADSETYNGYDRAIIAVYFASLCPFDFNGESLLSEQERLKNIGKSLLNYIRTGNVLAYEYPRWQYGYDDYAENVCWVCLRVTLTALAADCVPLPMPEPPEPPTPTEDYGAVDGLPKAVIDLDLGTDDGVTLCPLLAYANVDEDVQIYVVVWLAKEEMIAPAATINGDNVNVDIIWPVNEDIVAYLPMLTGYEGWYMYVVGSPGSLQPGTEVAAIVTEQGQEVLSCSGAIPE